MASNFHLIVLLVLVSIYVTSAYTLSTRDVLLKKYDDESYSRASSEQVSSMIDVKDQAKARSLQALVVVNKASRRKSWIKTTHKVGSLDVLTFVGIIILAGIVALVIIGVIIILLLGLCRRLETKMTQSIGQGEVGVTETGNETDEKMETVTMSPHAEKRSNGDANV